MLAPDTLIQNRYRVINLIGQGGMGAVYEAFDKRLNIRVALKQMTVVGPQLSRAFEREARILAELRHPALPRVIDHFTDDQGQFLVMDFITGNGLEAMLDQRQQPFEVAEVISWGDQILDALHYLHTQSPPIIHRDIKPQNLKMTPQGQIMLLDFGLAKGLSETQTQASSTASIAAYTPRYAPLEQIQGSGTDPRSDLFALGATLYHLLTGYPPINVLQRIAATTSHQPDPLRPVHELNPQVPVAFSQLIQQALSPDANQRPAYASHMRAALKNIHPVPASTQNTLTLPGNTGPTIQIPAQHHPSPQSMPTQPVPPPQPMPVQSHPAPAPIQQPLQQESSPTPPNAPKRPPVFCLAAAIGGAIALLLVLTLIIFFVMQYQNVSDTSTTPNPTSARQQSPMDDDDDDNDNDNDDTAPNAPSLPTDSPAPMPTDTPAPTDMPAPTNLPESFGPLAQQRPVHVSASTVSEPSVDSAGNPITYNAANALDGRTDTTWRVDGDGTGEFILLEFAEPIRVHEIQLIPGYAKIDRYDGTDRFLQNRRVRRVRFEFSDGSSVEARFTDQPVLQSAHIEPVVSRYVRIVIVETIESSMRDKRDFTPISEIVVMGQEKL